MTINDLAQYATVFTALTAAIYYGVLEPLKNEIKRLSELITRVNDELEASKDDRRHISERLAALEMSDKSAHKRIERIEHLIFNEEHHHE